jgi:L-seryl-tRNA(Ser) seleniumtransferase
MSESSSARDIPSVDEVLRTELLASAIERFGRPAAVAALRAVIETVRAARLEGRHSSVALADVADKAVARLEADAGPNIRPVFNLTGTILHTNLGRAVLADPAIAAATTAMREAIALEFDLASGHRGERDCLVRDHLRALTGAEAATLVNNNAAAVLLVLNTIANRREAVISRGELIEIGGAFRLPEIMARAGVKLVEVGTTNRTHPQDYVAAIGPKTGLVLKVHTSNYWIDGFTAAVPARALAAITREQGVPLIYDLGSGTLIDLSRYGLAKEPTAAEAVADGADLVTFSGDKLLGGPQAGFVVGRKDLIARINRNPMKRALRVDKIRLAAIEATLRLYRDPERLSERLPTFRFIARPRESIHALAERLLPALTVAVGPRFRCEIAACDSEVGSGALPQQTIPSAGIALRPAAPRGHGRALLSLAAAFRRLPVPVIGRIADQALIFDLRCLESEAAFARNLEGFLLSATIDAGS